MAKGGSPMGGGGFGGQQQQQGGFGGGFGGQRFNQMPQQQQQQQQGGFGGGFGGQQTMISNARYTGPQPQQRGFGGFDAMSQFFNQSRQQQPMAPQQRNPMRPMVGQMAPEQNQPSAIPASSTDMNVMMNPFRQQANQMMQQQGDDRFKPQVRLRAPVRDAAQEANQKLQAVRSSQHPSIDRMYEQFQSTRGQSGMLQPNVNRSLSQPQMPSNPYAQQVRQEDPRMQAMRMMQRMNFGGGGGYNF